MRNKAIVYPEVAIPNTNFRSRSKQVDGILIHSMAEYVESVEASEFLQDTGLSAHYLIRPDGTVVKCVDPDKRAYHAGKSKWGGQSDLNANFIGIELLVKGNHSYSSFLEAIEDPMTYTTDQYKSCGILCRSLLLRYPEITIDRILMHSDVSGDNVRGEGKGKVDPGPGFSIPTLKDHIEGIKPSNQ